MKIRFENVRLRLSASTFLLLFTVTVPLAVSAEESLTASQGDAILQELREIKRLLANPGPAPTRAGEVPARRERATRQTVSMNDGGHVVGSPDAPLTLVEFSDYQCPYCRRFFNNTLARLKSEYIDTGRLRLVVRDLPLPFHAQAESAGVASQCAAEQDAFWDMRVKLFSESDRLAAGDFAGMAKDLGLNSRKFKRCLASPETLQAVRDSA